MSAWLDKQTAPAGGKSGGNVKRATLYAVLLVGACSEADVGGDGQTSGDTGQAESIGSDPDGEDYGEPPAPGSSSSPGTQDDDAPEPGEGSGGDQGPGDDDGGQAAVCQTDAVFPEPDWAVADPADFGLDPAKLEAAAGYAEANDSSCLVVVRDGRIVFERYFMGTDASTPVKSWSVAKSYASALMGIAIGRGELGSIEDSIADYLPQFVGTDHAAVTLRHMLSMTTGMYAGLIKDMADMFYAPDMTAMAVAVPVSSEPGTQWRYSNVAVQLLEPSLHVASGVQADVYAEEHLWSPIGMSASWMTDEAGNPSMYMNVMASCRDHARFGHLYLNNGCWDGVQVVPEAWVAESTSPSQELNLGYGYWWWLSGGTPTLDLIDSSVLPSATLHAWGPDDSYCADGLGSQTIEVMPSKNMVVVRMGRSPMEDIDGNPLPLFPILEMLDDGKMRTHNGVVERVLAAVVD